MKLLPKKMVNPVIPGKLRFDLKKLITIIFIVLLSGFLVFCFSLFNDRRTFNILSTNLFIDELAANTLNMHYMIAYPENFGIEYTPRLSAYNPDLREVREAELDNMIMALEGITSAFLKPADRYTYDLLKSYLHNVKEGMRFHFFDDPLSPGSGAQLMLPILLNDYRFRSEKDVENYLQILDQIDDYLAGLCAFERDKAEAGLFMSDKAVNKVIEQCDMIMDKNEIIAGTHFLQISFKERLQELVLNGTLTDEQMEAYIAENNRLLLTEVATAYIRTGDELFLLKGMGQNDLGLAHFPEGQEYYMHLLSYTTGSVRSIEEIKQMLFQDFRSNYNDLIHLLQTYPELNRRYSVQAIPFILDTPEAMIHDLESRMADDFPCFNTAAGGSDLLIADSESGLVPLAIRNVSPAMENYASPAYYLSPPIDFYWENTIYINPKNNLAGLSLYTTLAHEGYPGHLYQTVYHRIFMEHTNGNPIRHILHFGGYQEGWALYVEMEAFNYAKSLMAPYYPAAEYVYEYYRLNHAMQLGLYSLLDIAIHYDGADLEQVRKILLTIGIDDEDACNSIFDYIVSEPANYPKYYLGFLEILALKDEAAALWGDSYRDYDFHRFFLEAGPSDFGMLRERVGR